jgi:phospholipid/cholesterol/gamma-HCH transport system substrate-binding protein
VGDNADSLANELNALTRSVKSDVNNGKGTIHALLKDSLLVQKLNNSLQHIEKGTEGFNQNMEALKSNFLFRGYFRKLEKKKNK